MSEPILPRSRSYLRASAHNDWFLEVKRGHIRGLSALDRFGSASPGDDYEDLWPGGLSYTGFDATVADTVELFSADAADTDSGDGAHAVEVFGLNRHWHPIREIVPLNGITVVETQSKFIRLDSMVVRRAGDLGANVGDLTARQKLNPAIVFCKIPAGYNESICCVFSVPVGREAYLYSWCMSYTGPLLTKVAMRFSVRPESEVFQVKEQDVMENKMPIGREYLVPKGPYPEKSDVKISASSSRGNTDVYGHFTLVLAKNSVQKRRLYATP